jgi:hypothetical protein
MNSLAEWIATQSGTEDLIYLVANRGDNRSQKGGTSMELRFLSAVFFTIVFLGAITCLTGCATTGMDRATKTTNLMDTVEGDYRQPSVQIDATSTSLEDLIKPDQTDMKKANNAYTEDLRRMEKLGKQLNRHTEQVRALSGMNKGSAVGCEIQCELN